MGVFSCVLIEDSFYSYLKSDRESSKAAGDHTLSNTRYLLSFKNFAFKSLLPHKTVPAARAEKNSVVGGDTDMDCLRWCKINAGKISEEMLFDKEHEETTVDILKTKSRGVNYRLEHAPLGNTVEDPTVIICGITPDYDAWQLFLNSIRGGMGLEKASTEAVFLTLKENLYKCLDAIGLFSFLASENEYWRNAQEEEEGFYKAWQKLYTVEGSRMNPGIQLTQACDCSILRRDNLRLPTQTALNEVRRREPKCLFNRFTITPSLKLIIFLGMIFKVERHWEESVYYVPGIKTISVPHPSKHNRVYNNDDVLKAPRQRDNIQLQNSKARLKEAKELVESLYSK